MKRRDVFLCAACAVFIWAARLYSQSRIPSRARTRSPFQVHDYAVEGWRVLCATLISGSEVRFLAVDVRPQGPQAFDLPSTLLEIFKRIGLVEPAREGFQPVETKSNGKIVWILSVGEKEKMRVRNGLIYRVGNWFNRPPAESVDSRLHTDASPVLITFGRESPTGQLV